MRTLAVFAAIILMPLALHAQVLLEGGKAPPPGFLQFQPGPEAQALQKDIEAVQKPGTATAGDKLAAGCGILSFRPGCILYWIFDALTDLLVTTFVSFAALIFNAFVNLSITTNLAQTPFVTIGFAITRGVANMFFVLILLWIAIATIFDFEPYTARSLLPKLIIAALLINFSLAIGNSFIRLGNGIAAIFYRQLQKQPVAAGGAPIYKDWLPATGIARRVMLMSNFAAVVDTSPRKSVQEIDQGFQKEVADKGCKIEEQEDVFRTGADTRAVECGNAELAAALNRRFVLPSNADDTLLTAFQAIFWKLIMTPVIIFVLLAGAIFLLVRIISLALLLVLGPIAFLFMILPATHGFYNQWWERLAKWSFFFPAFMFFLFLSLETGARLLPANLGNTSDARLPIMLQFFLTIALLFGSLLAANQMGIYGASTVTGWGKKMSRGVGRWTRQRAGRTALRYAAPVAKRVEEGTGALARTLRAIPGVTRAAQVTAQAQRATVAKREGDLGKYSDDELKRLVAMRGTTTNTRAAALNALVKRNNLREDPRIPGFDADRMRGISQTLHNVGADIRSIERLRPDIALPQIDPATGLMRTQNQATRHAARGARPVDLENMERGVAANVHVIQGIIDRAGSAHMQKLAERNDELTDAVATELQTMAAGVLGAGGRPSAAAVAAALRARTPPNEGLARFVVSEPGRDLFGLDP